MSPGAAADGHNIDLNPEDAARVIADFTAWEPALGGPYSVLTKDGETQTSR